MLPETAHIPTGPGALLTGDLEMPEGARGVVAFAHGSGSSRHSPRNRAVAGVLRDAGLGTLLFDLLTEAEERTDAATAEHRFDIPLLARRLVAAVDWLAARPDTTGLPIGLFGASTGAAAALVAAAERPETVRAVVSRGGRPDLAGGALDRVETPVLLIVGGEDREVLRLNERAAARTAAPCTVHVVPGATHLFEEPGALDQVAAVARDWFVRTARRAAPR
ncbi:hydrolase [Streptomyces sp. TRM43335]|uniref:Hydrolase n=1 Tax=Streptomyces taklimakanensis TaxID=2569853 RepID=A0A6G2B7V8_9ACTN|nr:dienelactone hydrolase family protein [Streptomyces taklimakanensis]MTE17992.1 hydrolase [Streptomyces taklimakanensis]